MTQRIARLRRKRPLKVPSSFVFSVLVGVLVAGLATPSLASTGSPGGLGLSLTDGQTVSKQVAVYAGGGATQDVALSVDGSPLASTPTASSPALVTFEGDGIQSGSQLFYNSLWVNGRMVAVIRQDVSSYATVSVPVPVGYLQPGANVVTVRSGDSVSPTDLVQNHDDFTIRNVQLVLPDHTPLTDPGVPASKVISLGDGFPGGNATEQEVTANFNMTAAADQLDGAAATWDTTQLPDGSHVVTATGTAADGSPVSVSATVTVDNTPPQVSIPSPVAGTNYQGADLQIAPDVRDASGVASESAKLDGTTIPLPDSFPSDNLGPGKHALAITAADNAGNVTTVTREFSTSVGNIPASRYEVGQVGSAPHSGPARPTLVAAGDIACSPGSSPTQAGCQQASTAALVKGINPDVVATVGDEQYDVGTLSNFDGSFNQTWGSFKDITYPVIGNHEYGGNNYPGAQASGYFDYFNGVGTATGRAGDRNRGYYSYNLGSWHIVVLNAGGGEPAAGTTDAKCGVVSCAKGSGQQVWLANDLAANHNKCTLAMWHQPRFDAGYLNDGGSTRPLWDTLYASGADVVLNGHDHNYERYAPQNPAGQADPAHGIREFIVGTGGDSHTALQPNATGTVANLQTANDNTFGVLQLQLNSGSYTWRFVPAPGTGSFTDSGTARCHSTPSQ